MTFKDKLLRRKDQNKSLQTEILHTNESAAYCSVKQITIEKNAASHCLVPHRVECDQRGLWVRPG